MNNKIVYRIKDFPEHFENSHSKKVQGKLTWCRIPCRHDGLGYRRLAKHEKSCEVFTAWILIVQVANQCAPRGVLIDEYDIPLNAEDISIKTGFPPEIFELAFEVLADPRIGWLEKIEISEAKVEDLPV